ncbi:hypothetical protein M899_3157 [Bacteriovorax sp. BSW11_IV]|uniref:hypothetical protein n=1 Tax=Bacteriovorax sp. BSW11_IV TaxID=1353529 RepID=UPI00038A0C09|nr:hypothetical protein [Bacteriovorax sp. BSW11_IV]EQC45238.1 hypothetical protein M899_3157 [Bacteriovorax sp. BSW11_IV]
MRRTNIFIILSIFIFGQISSLAEIGNLPSLEWQKQGLEDKINGKVESLLLSILKRDQFSVDVEIVSNNPADPEFNKPLDANGKKKGTGIGPNGEVELSEEEKAKIEEEKKLEEAKKSNAAIKFSDVEPDANTGDHIVFSKFGMEAPLIDDFKDFQPDGKIFLTMENDNDKKKLEELKEKFNEKEKQYQERIKKLQYEKSQSEGQVSPVEQMWKYNNTIDIFKNLKEVNILVRLSEGLDEPVKKKIEKYVRDLRFNLGSIEPSIKFEYSILGNDINQPTKMDKMKEWLEYASKYATLFGIVIGTILFGLIANGLVKKYFELNTGVSNTGNFKMDGGADQKDSAKEEGLPALPGGFDAGEMAVAGLNGIERFKFYIKNTPNDAIMLVKKWVRGDEKGSDSALRALVQQMENDELKIIFGSLSENERTHWRNLLDKPLHGPELSRANDFISNQIVQSVIVPSTIDDPETYDLILKLTPEKVVAMVQADPKMSAILMNALSLSFVNEVLSKCPENIRDTIINKSVEVKAKDVVAAQGTLKSLLAKYVETVEEKPFVEKLLKLIPMTTPDLEESLFKALARNINADVLKTTALSNFPAALISELPVPFLKSVLSSYPLEKKVKMLLSVDEEIRTIFMEIFAPEGSKANDLIMIEFESYERDESEMDKITENASKYWHDFVLYTRNEINKDKTYSKEISDLLETWSQDMEVTKKNHLREVA